MATKYRKKPVVIEAMRFTDRSDVEEILLWGAPVLETDALAWDYGFGAYIKPNGRPAITGVGGMHPGCLILKTPDSDALVEPGDYIVLLEPDAVTGRKFYGCTADVFEATYEPATINAALLATVRPKIVHLYAESDPETALCGITGITPGTTHADAERSGICTSCVDAALAQRVTPDPDDARQVETVARATCLISPRHRTADKCLFHGEYETAPGSGFCQIGSGRARAVLTALAKAVGR